jgi:hypothetical protein
LAVSELNRLGPTGSAAGSSRMPTSS